MLKILHLPAVIGLLIFGLALAVFLAPTAIAVDEGNTLISNVHHDDEAPAAIFEARIKSGVAFYKPVRYYASETVLTDCSEETEAYEASQGAPYNFEGEDSFQKKEGDWGVWNYRTDYNITPLHRSLCFAIISGDDVYEFHGPYTINTSGNFEATEPSSTTTEGGSSETTESEDDALITFAVGGGEDDTWILDLRYVAGAEMATFEARIKKHLNLDFVRYYPSKDIDETCSADLSVYTHQSQPRQLEGSDSSYTEIFNWKAWGYQTNDNLEQAHETICFVIATTDGARAIHKPFGNNAIQASPTCEANISGVGFGWVICWALNGISEGLEATEGFVESHLTLEPKDYHEEFQINNKENFTYKDAWSNVRTYMTFTVIGTALFMIISTALDFGFFSNYTVKKYLPRLIVGTILIQFSWALGDLLIQLTNQIGGFMQSLLYAAVPGAVDHGLEDIFGNGGFSTLLAGGAGVAALTWVLLLPVGFTGLVFFFLGFLFLVARKYLLIMLLILTPLGLALWVLPGSDKIWKTYSKTFTYLLIFYPVVVTVIAAGKIFSYLILL